MCTRIWVEHAQLAKAFNLTYGSDTELFHFSCDSGYIAIKHSDQETAEGAWVSSQFSNLGMFAEMLDINSSGTPRLYRLAVLFRNL